MIHRPSPPPPPRTRSQHSSPIAPPSCPKMPMDAQFMAYMANLPRQHDDANSTCSTRQVSLTGRRVSITPSNIFQPFPAVSTPSVVEFRHPFSRMKFLQDKCERFSRRRSIHILTAGGLLIWIPVIPSCEAHLSVHMAFRRIVPALSQNPVR